MPQSSADLCSQEPWCFTSHSLNVWLVFGLGLVFQWHGYLVSPLSEKLEAVMLE